MKSYKIVSNGCIKKTHSVSVQIQEWKIYHKHRWLTDATNKDIFITPSQSYSVPG